MTFLDPIAGIIGAAVALPLLLALYFLKLRRRPVRVSSTFLWETAVRDLQANVPFRWIRPSLLLFLQLLALGLLLAALARPALDAPARDAGRVIILIDRSASMSAPLPGEGNAPPRTRLDEARSQALELIGRLESSSSAFDRGRSTDVAVITFAAGAAIISPSEGGLAAAARAVESITPTDQPGDLDAALALAEPQLRSTDESAEAAATRIVLFSDGAFAPSLQPASRRPGIGRADFRFVPIGAASPPADAPVYPVRNLGIVALAAQRDFQRPALVRVFARIQNNAPERVEAPLTLRVDGSPVAVRTVPVPARSENGPGEAAATFDVEVPGAGTLLLSIDRPDGLEADNAAAAALLAPRAPRILIVRAPAGGPGDDIAADALTRALGEVAGEEPRTIDPSAYEELALQRAPLRAYDLVVFDRYEPTAPPPAPSLSFGAALPALGVTLADDGAPADRVLSWRRTDPLLQAVALDTLVLAGAPSIALPEDAAASVSVRTRTLASGAAGPLIVAAEDAGRARIVVSFPLARSTWPLQPSFVVFLANLVDFVTPAGEAATARAWTTAEPVALRAEPGAASVVLAGPSTARAAAPEGGGTVRVGPLEHAGVYTAEGVADADRFVPVNLADSTESDLAVAPAVDVAGRAVSASSLADAAPREVWPWFVLAAFALLALEWLLFAWRSRV